MSSTPGRASSLDGSCPDVDTLVDLVEGSLDARTADATRTHLDGCDACQSAVAQLLLSSRNSPHARDDAAKPWVGRTLANRYALKERLGAGAMAEVFLGRDLRLERAVAVKILRAPRREHSDSLSRESKAMAGLRHPNVVTVHDVLLHDGHIVVVMEYVRGSTLRQWFEQGPHPWAAVLDVMLQAAAGLACANEAGWIHRDFKPDNVLVGDDDRVQVTDFGLARLSSAYCDTEVGNADDPAQTDALVGTPAYMAPEQWERRRVDARADVFALCTTVYEGLAGRRPFDATDVEALQDQKRAQSWAPLSRSRVPRGIAAVVEAGLSSEPSARPATVGAFIAQIHAARRQRSRVALGIVGLGTAGLLGWAALPAPTPCDTPPEPLWTPELRARAHTRWGDASDWPTVEQAIDTFHRDWAVQWQAHCDAPSPEPVLCLRRQQAWTRSTVQMLARGDLLPRRVARALPPPRSCSDGSPPPIHRAEPHDAEALRTDLQTSWQQLTAGEYDQVLQGSDALLERARAMDDAWLQADVERVYGEALYVVGRTAHAREVLLSAADHAATANHTACQVEVWLVLARATLDDRADVDLSREYTTLAERAVERLGDAPWAASMRVAIAEQRAKIVDHTPDTDEAVRRWESVLSLALRDDPPSVFSARIGLAYALKRRGDHARALTLLRETLAEYERTFPGEESEVTAMLHLNLSASLYAAGDYEAALHHNRDARRITLASAGRENDTTVKTRVNELLFLVALGHLEPLRDAEQRLLEVLERVEELPPRDAWATAGMLVEVAWYRGDDTTCIARNDALVERPGVDRDDIAVVYARVAASDCLVAAGRIDEAVRHADAALRSAVRGGADVEDQQSARIALGRALLAAERIDEADTELRVALAQLSTLPDSPVLPLAWSVRARIDWARGRTDDATAAAHRAASGLRGHPDARRTWSEFEAWARARGIDP